MPFNTVYQPGFHLTVALLATVAHWQIPVAYHMLTALAYALGPVALFVLCAEAGDSRAFALVAAFIYSLYSPLALLAPAIRTDAGGYFNPRRLQVLIKYGEGPHITSLALLPIAIFLIHRAVTDGRRYAAVIAPLIIAAIALTNWPGSVGLSFAIVSYIVSRIGSQPPLHWSRLVAICTCAYAIVSPWIPPSTILSVVRNAQESDYMTFGYAQVFGWLAVLLLVMIGHFRTRSVRPWTRFFIYFFIISGSVAFGNLWFHLQLLPQAHRFQLEVEMALAGVVSRALCTGFNRLTVRSMRWLLLTGFSALCLFQLRNDIQYARTQISSLSIEKRVEYRMANAFKQLEGHKRVFAPGNVSLWMNLFTNVPQVAGCCDQGIPTMEHRIAPFVIYSGLNAGPNDTAVSILWLQAYGANAVGVTGRRSTEPIKPFANPEKFDGVLPELWRDADGDVIYEVPQFSASLAHVINRSDIIYRAPINGLDTNPLKPYVKAIESRNYPRSPFTWINAHEARVEATFNAGQVLSVQITYDPRWRARINGLVRAVRADPLGMIVIEPECTGKCVIDLSFEPKRDWLRITQISAILVGVIFLFNERLRRWWCRLGSVAGLVWLRQRRATSVASHK